MDLKKDQDQQRYTHYLIGALLTFWHLSLILYKHETVRCLKPACSKQQCAWRQLTSILIIFQSSADAGVGLFSATDVGYCCNY